MTFHVCEQSETIGALKTDVKNLKVWQKKQNGVIQRIEGKVDGLYTAFNKLLAGVAVACILLMVDILLRLAGWQ